MRWPWKKPTYQELEFKVKLPEYDTSDPMSIAVGDMWMEVFEIMEGEDA